MSEAVTEPHRASGFLESSCAASLDGIVDTAKYVHILTLPDHELRFSDLVLEENRKKEREKEKGVMW